MFKRLFTSVFFLLLAPLCIQGEDNPSQLVGVIDWADSQGESLMSSFIERLAKGHTKYITLPNDGERERIEKDAKEYMLYLYSPSSHPTFGSEEKAQAYKAFREYHKYEALKNLAKQAASTLGEDLKYALSYDLDSLLSATGVKIAKVANEAFSTPYSRLVSQQVMNYTAELMRSSADLAIAQQAAFYRHLSSKKDFKDLYRHILAGFNSAESSKEEVLEEAKKKQRQLSP